MGLSCLWGSPIQRGGTANAPHTACLSGATVYTQVRPERFSAIQVNAPILRPSPLTPSPTEYTQSTPTCVYSVGDGGRGFWRVYRQCFAHCAIGILDFYHAAGHLWRATTALLDGRSLEAHRWFKNWRSLLRHGQHQGILDALTLLMNTELTEGKDLETLSQVQAYFQAHHQHIRYQHFEDQHFPLGSGMIESACKWLIQQRFKGVGMRWSEDGFNHLLPLRLDWVNQRFDSLFPLVHEKQINPSHNP
jgi:hypothetical protein